MIVQFDAEVYRWHARQDADWYFAAVPVELSADIREVQTFRRGFGGVRVEARIGTTTWRTSIFPQSDGRYVLPLKRAVREAEGIGIDGVVSVRLAIIDA